MLEGRIVRILGGFYTVKGADGAYYTLRGQNKLRKCHLTPFVGDRVTYTLERAREDSWLTGVLPRKNCLKRPPVANIDLIVLTIAAESPKPDLLLIDSLLWMALRAEITPILVVNKLDQEPRLARAIADEYRAIDTYVVCAETGEGIEGLLNRLRGTIHAFGGQSGVGKSTLINRLYGMSLKTGQLSDKIERGKHTTRHTELIEVLENTMVLDTPGFSLLESDRIDPITLKAYYPEFAPYEGACRFAPCAHYKEPGCAVRDALASGAIDRNRYERYQRLFEEMQIKWRERYD